MNTKTIVASGPVIVEDGKVLLNKSDGDDFWKFCGGKLEHNENLEETAIREVREEMGLSIKITGPIPFLMHTKKPNDPEIDVILVHFLAKRLNEINPGPETTKWKWHDIEDLPKDLAPNIKPALEYFGFI